MIRKILLFSLIIPSNLLFSQNFDVYIQKNRYDVLINSNNLYNYYYFSHYYLETDGKDEINLEKLRSGIESKIPKSSKDLIVLDLENKNYHNLKSSVSEREYKISILKMIEMIETAKKLRPQAEVVVYGLPFAFNYQFQEKYNEFKRLKPLLEKVDYVAPAIYLYYSEFEKSPDEIRQYIDKNLKLSFEYALKLNKQVLPFVWYRIHPSNKLFGGKEITARIYEMYLSEIKKYSYKKRKVKGVIYWEPSKESLDINIKLEKSLKLLR
jgi:hypothetical protein